MGPPISWTMICTVRHSWCAWTAVRWCPRERWPKTQSEVQVQAGTGDTTAVFLGAVTTLGDVIEQLVNVNKHLTLMTRMIRIKNNQDDVFNPQRSAEYLRLSKNI